MHYKRWHHHPGSFAQRPTAKPHQCAATGCPRPARTTGKLDPTSPSALYCQSHYQQNRYHGDPGHADRNRERYRTVGVKSNGYYRSSDSKGKIGDLVHRTVIGAKPDEVVHHIDFDKTHNVAPNLIALSRGRHGTLHHSLDSIIAELMRRGIVTFDREAITYRLTD